MFGKRRQVSASEVAAEAQAVTNLLLQSNASRLARAQDALTSDHERILDYFWDETLPDLRLRLPESVIWFFETDHWHETLYHQKRSEADLPMEQLVSKKYLDRKRDSSFDGASYLELAPKGAIFLIGKHPTVPMFLSWFVQWRPTSVIMFATVIGIPASVLGIFQLIAWLR
jgi:hypothetical protein